MKQINLGTLDVSWQRWGRERCLFLGGLKISSYSCNETRKCEVNGQSRTITRYRTINHSDPHTGMGSFDIESEAEQACLDMLDKFIDKVKGKEKNE